MLSVDEFAAGADVIDHLVEAPQAAALVRSFYDPQFAEQHSRYADFVGEAFTTLGTNEANRFETDDLVAVHMMGMRFRPTAVRALLVDPGERQCVQNLLSRIPNVDIWSDAASLDAADELWSRLTSMKRIYRGLNWVTAGKLLARKRPGLIPIVDQVVVRLIPRPSAGYWRLFRHYLRQSGSIEKVEALRPKDLPRRSTPTLRLLDTVIWMSGSQGRGAREVRETLGLIETA